MVCVKSFIIIILILRHGNISKLTIAEYIGFRTEAKLSGLSGLIC